MTVGELERYVARAAVVFLRDIRGDDVWIHGPVTDPCREYPAALCARMHVDSFLSDGRSGQPVVGLKLSKLIESRFDRDDRERVDAMIARDTLLIFTIDNVGDHKKIPSVMDDLIVSRRGCPAPTLYLSDTNIAKLSGRYGPGVSGFFALSFKPAMSLGTTNTTTIYSRKRAT